MTHLTLDLTCLCTSDLNKKKIPDLKFSVIRKSTELQALHIFILITSNKKLLKEISLTIFHE